jgi:hypothetical protein
MVTFGPDPTPLNPCCPAKSKMMSISYKTCKLQMLLASYSDREELGSTRVHLMLNSMFRVATENCMTIKYNAYMISNKVKLPLENICQLSSIFAPRYMNISTVTLTILLPNASVVRHDLMVTKSCHQVSSLGCNSNSRDTTAHSARHTTSQSSSEAMHSTTHASWEAPGGIS